MKYQVCSVRVPVLVCQTKKGGGGGPNKVIMKHFCHLCVYYDDGFGWIGQYYSTSVLYAWTISHLPLVLHSIKFGILLDTDNVAILVVTATW